MDLKTWPPDSFIRRRRDIAAGGLDIPGPRVYLGPGYTRDAGTSTDPDALGIRVNATAIAFGLCLERYGHGAAFSGLRC